MTRVQGLWTAVMTDVLKSPEAGSSRVGEVGRLLRETREESRQAVSDVSDRLRIRSAFLVAIEEGRYNDLPGPTYAVGFVRAYAGFLGLDSIEIVRRFREESAMVPNHSHLDFPGPASDGGMPSRNLLIAALVLVGLVYGGWRLVASADTSLAVFVQEVPDRFMSLITGGSGSAVDIGDEPVLREPEMPGHADVDDSVVRMAPALSAGESAPLPDPGVSDTAGAEGEMPPVMAEGGADDAVAPGSVAPGASPEEAGHHSDTGPVHGAAPSLAQPDEPVLPVVSPDSANISTSVPSVASPAAVVSPALPDEGVRSVAPIPPLPLSRPRPPVRRDPLTAPVERNGSVTDPAGSGSAPLRMSGSERVGGQRIVLRATQDSWVQVRSPQGLVLSRLMRRGEVLEIPGRRDLELMTGNAGGLKIEVDGAVMPVLGKVGEVRRRIPLNPDALKTAENPAG